MDGPITFSGGTLDRVATRRSDAAWVRSARDDARALAVVGGPRGVGLEPEPLEGRDGVLLGVRDDGVPVWAVEAEEGDQLADLRMSVGSGLRRRRGPAGLRAVDPPLAPHASLLWRVRQAERGERRAASSAGVPNGHSVHPRTDPVCIMLVVDGDRALLGRQPSWPPGRYSALAGFVEPGESLEAAVAREVAEEAGVEVGEVRYRASQPWPFPASLMIGFEADYAGGTPDVGDDELEDVRWFSRDRAPTQPLPPTTTRGCCCHRGWRSPGDSSTLAPNLNAPSDT